MGGLWVDLTGNKYGMLTVLGESGRNKNKMKIWRCKCECGNETLVTTNNLKRGHTQSCGCLFNKTMIKHGMCNTRLYRIWHNIKQRCNNPNRSCYKNYGGRGIKVCDEWLEDFLNFYNWSINNGYSEELELDRINNDKGYSPDNCRWVTHSENNRNKRNNHYLTYQGKTLTLMEWQEITGIPYQEIRRRLINGKTIQEALT